MAEGKISYAERLKDPRWQKKRLEIMQRDGWGCMKCGSKDKFLNVHHLKYTQAEPHNELSENLITLCHECHEKTHAKSIPDGYSNEIHQAHIKDHLPEIKRITEEIEWLMTLLQLGEEQHLPYLNFLFKQRHQLRNN